MNKLDNKIRLMYYIANLLDKIINFRLRKLLLLTFFTGEEE